MVLDLAQHWVFYDKAHLAHGLRPRDARSIQPFARRRAVGPDKSADAEQRPAEVASDHHRAVVQVFAADDFENGPAGGSGRFAVVA